MPIRSRRFVGRASSPPQGSVWPGFGSWLLSLGASLFVFSLLAALAWRSGSTGKLPDVTLLFITVPAAGFALLILIAAVWAVLAKTPIVTSLAFLARMAPAAWIFPALDLARSAGQGIGLASAPFNATEFLLAALTGTVFPLELPIPFGMRAGLLAVALLAAFFVWFTLRASVGTVGALWRAAVAGVIVSAATVKLAFAVPLLGIQRALLHGGSWIGNALEAPRQALLAVQNGYWWNNLYERFPSAVEPQADLAIRLTMSGIIVTVLGVFLVALFLWQVPSWRRILRHAFRAWRAFDLALYAVGGALITAAVIGTLPSHGTWWMAALLALLLLAALRMHTVLERCLLHQARGDEAMLVTQDLSADRARDLSQIAFLFSLAAAWVLGWPVFGAVVIFLATARLSRDPLWAATPWTGTLFRAIGAASLALAGAFFMAQNARLSGLAVVLMLAAALHRVGAETLGRHLPTPRS